MPPKGKGVVEGVEAPPPPPDPLGMQAEELAQSYAELKDAMARGEKNLTTGEIPADGTRKWAVAVTRPKDDPVAARDASANAGQGPELYAEWVRRFGFSIEREIDFQHKQQQQQQQSRLATTKAHRHIAHLKAVTDDPAFLDKAKQPQRGPVTERPPLFPYAVAKEQIDTIMSMELHESAGDAFELTRRTDYDDVDFHALVNVGACHPHAVGAKDLTPQAGTTEADAVPAMPAAAPTLEQTIAALTRPYMTTTWRVSAFDAAHFKVRAIARWIAAFVRVVAPPLGPPPAAAAAAHIASPTTAATKKAAPAVAAVAPTDVVPVTLGRHAHEASKAAAEWVPYRTEDNDPEDDPLHAAADEESGRAPLATPWRVGETTALAVFASRIGDPHQIATLFSYMCRHPAAGLVFSSSRMAAANVSGHFPLEAHADEASYSAFASDRPTRALPTGVAAAYVQGKLGATPHETLRIAQGDARPCRVRTVRGTLKGTVDAGGKPAGYLAWSWNLVTLPDGKEYLVDVALCAADVPVKFLLLHQQSCAAVKAGELSPTGEAPIAGAKDPKGKAAEKAVAAPPASSADSAAATLTATFGAYQPLAGRLQFHHAVDLERTAAVAAKDTPVNDGESKHGSSVVDGTRGYCKAPLVLGYAMPPAVARTAVACVSADVAAIHALGPWAETPLPANGPYGVAQLSSLLLRTCFASGFFFADPRHFATLHYPDDQRFLLLRPPGADATGASPTSPKPETASTVSKRAPHSRLVTRAQWEAYPRLSPAALQMCFSLESHARRAQFAAKGCPVYMSFVLGDAPSTELQVTVFKGALATVTQSHSLFGVPLPHEGQSAEEYLTAVDRHLAATNRTSFAALPNILLSSAQNASAPPTGPPAAVATIDPTYYAITREEATRRSVLSLMFPDVGQYTVCVGARRLDAEGNPLSACFAAMTSYQLTVAWVPTNEPLMPWFLEPPTVAKLQAPATSRIAGGQVYFSVAPTLPRIISVAVVNETAVRPGAKKDAHPDSATAAKGSHDVERLVYFLPWDSTQAAFNGTCSIYPGDVSLWLGVRAHSAVANTLDCMVPSHLLPCATAGTTANLFTTLLADAAPCPTLAKNVMDLLQHIHTAAKPVGGALPTPLTPALLASSWRPQAEKPLADEPDKPAKGKSGRKNTPIEVAPPPPPTPKPKLHADFFPFVSKIVAVRRVPTKEATLLTNHFSPGAVTSPSDADALVLPPSLRYLPPQTSGEQKVMHGVLARTTDPESAAFVSQAVRAVGTAFRGV